MESSQGLLKTATETTKPTGGVLTKRRFQCMLYMRARGGCPDRQRPDSKDDAASKALRGITWMERLTLDRALGLYSRYSELEARANKVMLDVNALYLRGKLLKMKELLKGFSVFASEVSKAMLSIANDVRRVMMINNDISRPKEKE
jgi:hypothetical protein